MLTLDQSFIFRNQKVAWGSIGSGPAMVLVHGFPWSAQCWRNIAPWLAKTHRVFFFDMLGTGKSEKSPGQIVDESVQSDLLAELTAYWGLARPHVVGHDFGGLASLRAHFVNGVDYGALHLIDAVAVLPSGSPFYAHVRQHETVFAGLPEYAHEALFRAYIQNASLYPLRRDVSDLYFAPYSGPLGKAAFYAQIGQADIANISEAQNLYHKPDFPVHLIWGEEDSFIPPAQGRELRDLLGAESFTPIANAAHLIQEDAPEAILGAMFHNLSDMKNPQRRKPSGV